MRSTRRSTPRRPLATLVVLAAGCLVPALAARGADGFAFEKGDHLSILGNTLADRMQHDGWLETAIQARFPDKELVIRDLGFSGDELKVRLRSADFGSPDDWLARTKADAVFAFFGRNESFAGAEGVEGFKKDLAEFVKHTLGQKYNGKDAPRLVLFSPIATEAAKGRDLPDAAETNGPLKLYTAAMAEVAKAEGVPFVDIFAPSLAFFEKSDRPLTINGVHMTAEGDRLLARAIDGALFGEARKGLDEKGLESLRQGVLDKNFYWFNRYRTVDGYSIFGGRADLSFVGGQTNRVVARREMEVLDVMTANRDKRIWALANGKDLKVDDSNTPDFIPVVTNKPGQGAQRHPPLPVGRGRDQGDDPRQGPQDQPVRLGGEVPRPGQAGADVVRPQGPPVGRHLADLPALEAQGADE